MTPENRTALKHSPELLFEHLLGAPHAGPGLLARVQERVKEAGYAPGPGYRSGSITGQVDHHHDDSGDDDEVFRLYLVVKGWLGRAKDEASERRYLRQHQLSDSDALLKRHGLLSQLRHEVSRLAREQSEVDILRGVRLAESLMDWLGGRCLHLDLEPIAADEGITVLECSCGVRVHEDKRGNWLAV